MGMKGTIVPPTPHLELGSQNLAVFFMLLHFILTPPQILALSSPAGAKS